MLCPRCDKQGTVHTVKINSTGEVVHLCDECDALWPAGVVVTPSGFHDFSTYVAQFGLKGLWKEITVLDGESPS